MRIRTVLALFALVFNSLWLTHVFVVLFVQGYYPITEPVRWIAFGEIIICLSLAVLGIERLFHLREKK